VKQTKQTKQEEPKKSGMRRKSGWVAFQREMRPKIKEENEDLSASEVTALLSEMWSEMDADKKKEWSDKANV
jgi:hypothetical protein